MTHRRMTLPARLSVGTLPQGMSARFPAPHVFWKIGSRSLDPSRILAQTGLQAAQLEVALSALAKTTLAPTFENIEKTAEGAVAILAQFGRGVGALESQLGSINAVAGQFAVESGDLISAVRRTGGVFKSAGGDLNELLAYTWKHATSLLCTKLCAKQLI